MTRNYLSFDDIVKRNEGKKATYEIEKYIYPELMYALLSFDGGDRIRFYHVQDCCETTEWIKYKSFCGLIQNIELKEKECTEDHYESATKTHLLINGKNYSTWIISSNGYYSESISWELLKTEAELAEEDRIEKEQERLKQEQKEKEEKERLNSIEKMIKAQEEAMKSPRHAKYVSRCKEWTEQTIGTFYHDGLDKITEYENKKHDKKL